MLVLSAQVGGRLLHSPSLVLAGASAPGHGAARLPPAAVRRRRTLLLTLTSKSPTHSPRQMCALTHPECRRMIFNRAAAFSGLNHSKCRHEGRSAPTALPTPSPPGGGHRQPSCLEHDLLLCVFLVCFAWQRSEPGLPVHSGELVAPAPHLTAGREGPWTRWRGPACHCLLLGWGPQARPAFSALGWTPRGAAPTDCWPVTDPSWAAGGCALATGSPPWVPSTRK